MYRLLKGLRERLGVTQADFATRLGTDQTRVSKLEKGTAGKSFHELCNLLRRFTTDEKNARAWLQLLASGDVSDLLAEYRDLFLITENLKVAFQEVWIIAAKPAECERVNLRKEVAKRIRDHQAKVVYWAPRDSFPDLRTLAMAFEDEDKLSAAMLKAQIQVIETPSSFALLPMAIFDPRQDDRIGFLSPQIKTSEGVRVVVLPQETSAHIFGFLEPVYRLVQRDHHWEDSRSGFTWILHEFTSLPSDALPQAASPQAARNRGIRK